MHRFTRFLHLKLHVQALKLQHFRYQCTVRREIFEVAMVKFINIKKRRDLTADLKVRIDTGALNDFKKMK